LVYMAVVEHAHPSQGKLFVKVQNGYEMDELHDVSAQNPSNNDGLFYNTTSGLWENKSIVTALGYTPYNATNPAGYTTNTGTVTSVSGTGTVSGLTLTGSVTGSGSLTLGGTLSLTSGNVTTALGFTPYNATNPAGYITGITSGNVTTALGYTPANKAGDTFTGVVSIQASNDAQLYLNGNGTSWAGISWADVSGSDYIWYNGSTSTFAIGGGGSFVANKKLHVHGGMTIGSGLAMSASGTNSLFVQNEISAPIFRDSDNAAYFIDPNSTSVLNVIRGTTLQHSSGNVAVRLNGDTWTEFCDPNGATKLWLGGGDPNNYYNAGIHYFRNTSSGTTMTIDNAGNAIATASYRAPIFYDSANTAYYVDPASGSVLNRLVSITGAGNSNGGNLQLGDKDVNTAKWSVLTGAHYAGSSEPKGVMLIGSYSASGNNSLSIGGNVYEANPATYIAFYTATTGTHATGGFNRLNINGSGNVTAEVDIRSPIYYDSNDTAYYVDPNGNSVLNALYMRNGSVEAKFAQASNFGYSSSYRTIVLGNEYLTTISMGVDVSGNASGSFNGQGEGREVLFRNGVSFITPNSANNSYLNVMQMTDGVANFTAYATAGGSFRAPIFYDSNNTGYFVDPNSRSRLASMDYGDGGYYFAGGDWGYRHNTPYGWIQFGPANSGHAHIYTDRSNFYFNAQIQVLGGSQINQNDIRSPIFYDSDNTAYYFDGTGGTRQSKFLTINGNTGGNNGNELVVGNTAVTYSMTDTNLRPIIQAHGAYPVLSLNHTITANTLHGPSVQFTANGTGKQFVIGMSGNGSQLDIGNSAASDWNPHNGIGGYNGITGWRMDGAGNVYNLISSRSPIYYDNNDTGYYVDPNSVSVLNKLTAGQRQLVGYATLSMAGLDVNTYYPVTIPVPVSRQGTLRIENALNSNAPSWSTHPSGFSCYFEWTTNGLGWGTIGLSRRITDWREQYANVQIVGGIDQMTFSSTEVIWLRGGGNYYLSADFDVAPTIRTTSYELYGQTVAPRSSPFNNPRETATGRVAFGSLQTNEQSLFRGNIDISTGSPQLVFTSTTSGRAASFGMTDAYNMYLNAPSGGALFLSEPRASIFYDSNDTSYYVDPNSTSVLRDINAWGEIGSRRNDVQSILRSYNLSAGGPLQFYLDHNYGNVNIGNSRGVVFAGGSYWEIANSARAPIFYDSNNTGYYVDPNELSKTWRMGANYFQNNDFVSADTPFGLYFDSALSSAYAIYRESGGWTHPFPDLRIAFHTGIKMGANPSYGGIKFYTDYDMSTQVMSINNGSDPLGGSNVWVNNNLQAGSSLRAPIFYDSNDTNFYLDPNGTCFLNAVNMGPQTWRSDITWNTAVNINIPASAECSFDIATSGVWQVWDLTAGGPIIRCQNGTNTEIGQAGSRGLYVHGGLTASGNVTAYSDIRVKDNVTRIENALDKVTKIGGYTFTRTDLPDTDRSYGGVIAQEIEQVLPEAIFEKDDRKSVDYNATIGLLIEAIKELRNEVTTLKTKLN